VRDLSLTLVGRLRREFWIWPLLAAAMLAVAGFTIRRSVESAAQMELEEDLRALLQSNVEALRIWLETEEAQVAAAAGEGEIRRVAAELIGFASAADQVDDSTLVKSPLQEQLRAALSPILARKHFSGYVLFNKERRILACDHPEVIGQVRTSNYDVASQVQQRGTIVTPPVRSAVLTLDAQGEMRAGPPTMFRRGNFAAEQNELARSANFPPALNPEAGVNCYGVFLYRT